VQAASTDSRAVRPSRMGVLTRLGDGESEATIWALGVGRKRRHS
jgi:hypothetical protein